MVDATDILGEMPEASDAERAGASDLALALIQAEDRVAACEAALKEAEREEALLRDELLPKAMDDIRQTEFTLTGGFKVAVKDTYVCGQLDDGPDDPKKKDQRSQAERLAALQMLEKDGYGDVAKRVITIVLGAKSEIIARELIALLRSHRLGNQLNIDQRQAVLWNTLASFAKDRALAGEYDEVKLKALGVAKLRRAKITRPKQAKEAF